MDKKLKMYKFNNYQQFVDECVPKITDRTLSKANQTANYYFFMSNKSEDPTFFVLIDEEKKSILNFAFTVKMEKEPNCINIDFIKTPFKKNENKGYAGYTLDYICDYAKKNGYDKVHLDAIDGKNNPQFLYYKKGFVNVERPDSVFVSMFKLLDEKDWAFSVLFNESLNMAIENNVSPKFALNHIIKNEIYDSVFDYGVIKEEEFGDKKTNPMLVYEKWDKFAKNAYKNNNIVKAFCKAFSSKIEDRIDYVNKTTTFLKSFEEGTSDYMHCDNILDGIGYLQTSQKIDREMDKEKRLIKSANVKNKNMSNGTENNVLNPSKKLGQMDIGYNK